MIFLQNALDWKIRFRSLSSVDIEVIRIVFIYLFFYEIYSKHLKHKQKHLSNIQPNISISNKASK